MNQPICAIDIGNSTTGFALVDRSARTCLHTESCSTKQIDTSLNEIVCRFSATLAAQTAVPVRVSSVVPHADNVVCDVLALHKNFDTPRMVRYHKGLPVTLERYNPESLGADRLANVLYAQASNPHRTTAVIDTGTAITFDIITEQALYHGGAIMPGIRTQMRSLNAHTAQLPLAQNVSSCYMFPGSTTDSCIVTGVYMGISAGLTMMVQQARKQYGELDVLACGGDWEALAPHVDFDCTYVPHLTLIGTALFEP